MEEPNDLILATEAAKLRGVTRGAIYKLIRTGRLRSFQKYGVLLVSKSEVETFIPLKRKGSRGKEEKRD
jgi:excisionase family DNA binding protein